MRIKNLLMLAAFLAMSGSAMAQTELTAGKLKIVPGHQAEVALALKTPVEIGGWQMELALPAGLSLDGTSDKLKIGTEPEGGYPEALFFKDVTLSRGKNDHVVIGGYGSEGQPVVICVPTAKEAKISGTSGDLCIITLTADNDFVATSETKGEVKAFLASDEKGEKTYSAATITFDIVQLKYDITNDGKVNLADVRKIVNLWKAGESGYNLATARKAINEWKL